MAFGKGIKSSGGNPGIICGYAATWRDTPDKDGEIIEKGAFRGSLAQFAAGKKMIPLLFNHNSKSPSDFLGKVYYLKEDDYGLYFEAQLEDAERAQRLRTLCKDGRLHGVSFAFSVIKGGRVRLRGGGTARRLKEVELHEISITPWPSDDRARVTSVKKGNVNGQILRHADALLFRYEREERKRKATIEAARRLLGEK